MHANVLADNGGVWVTCADLASRRNVSRAAITKRVDALEREGKITTRREGRSRLVDLAAFDRAVGETGNAVKEVAATTARDQRDATPKMRDAQTEKAQYEARLKALDLAERQRHLLPITGEHGIEAAMIEIAATLARDADGLVRHAEEIATAVSRDGVNGARRVLKDIGRRFRTQMATSLNDLAAKGQEAERVGPIETVLPDE